ncbi:hypothetical protein IAI18_03420 [Acetobacteraceae bacterium H6797]|nr:hypothetical protein [Acetobacteraceae bacterium H6797]
MARISTRIAAFGIALAGVAAFGAPAVQAQTMAPPVPMSERPVAPVPAYQAGAPGINHTPATPAPIILPRGQTPTPANPFAGVNLPNEPQVGDGAYNGGGVVIESFADGTTRVVR